MSPNLLKTSTSRRAPLDGSGEDDQTTKVSDFLTIQSLSNFSAMTGAISAAWLGLQKLSPALSAFWVPYAFSFAFGLVSILISLDALKKDGRIDLGHLASAIFIAVINALVLASAVVGVVGVSKMGL